MDHRQQLQRRRKHPRVPAASPPPDETTSPAIPTTTPKSSPSPSTSPPPLTTRTPTSSISVEHKTSSSISPSDTPTSSLSSSSSITPATSSSESSSESSDSSSVSSTTSTTSSDSTQKPTTMTGYTTATGTTPLQSNPSVTNPLSKPTQTINGNTPNTSGNAASKSISGGTIAAIIFGAIAGTAGLLILFCFVRRKLRPRRRRHDWHARASFIHEGAVLEEDARPVIGTQNALALARTNMGHEAEALEPEMTQMNQPAAPVPSHWGAYDNNPQSPYNPYQDQYQYQQPAQPHYQVQDPRDVQPYADYNYPAHQEPQNARYAELARHLDIPPVALSPHPDSPAAGASASPALARSLSTSAYGSLSAHEPTPSQPTRSGSPVDANPQQAYISPNPENGHSAGHDGAYGGI